MRRSTALVCLAALLVVVLVVPLGVPAGIVHQALGLAEPTAPARFDGLAGDGAPLTSRTERVPLLLFRGPPVDGFPIAQSMENPRREEPRWMEHAGDAGSGGPVRS